MIYEPAEDSFLLAEQVKKFSRGKKVLDVGSGSGILIETAKKFGAREVLALEKDSESINYLKSKEINCRKSDLFSSVEKDEKFDLIIFNPPYLPEDDDEDIKSRLATTGGKNGDEIIIKFLREAIKHLVLGGKILLLVSSLTPKDRIEKLLRKQKLKVQVIAEEKLFFEKLEVWKIERQ